MKKLLAFLGLVGIVIIFLTCGIVPGTPPPGECSKFHPHDQFGGPIKTVNFLDWLSTLGKINVWMDGTRMIVHSTYNGQAVFLSYGQGNPTMFIPKDGMDYINDQTRNLKKVTSLEGIKQVRNYIGYCLRPEYEKQYVPIPVPLPEPAKNDDALKVIIPNLVPLGMCLIIVILVLKVVRRVFCALVAV